MKETQSKIKKHVQEVTLLPVISYWDRRLNESSMGNPVPFDTFGTIITFDSDAASMYVYPLMLDNELMCAMVYHSVVEDEVITQTLQVVPDISDFDICDICDNATHMIVTNLRHSDYIDNRQFTTSRRAPHNTLFSRLVGSVYMSVFITLALLKLKVSPRAYPISPFIWKNDELHLDTLVNGNNSIAKYNRGIVWQSKHLTEFQEEMHALINVNNIRDRLSRFAVNSYKLVMSRTAFIMDRLLVVISGNTMSSAIIPSQDSSPMIFKLFKIK